MTFDSSKRVMLLATALCGFTSAGIANAGSGDIYNLGTLGGAYQSASQINDAGQVTGSSQIAPGGDSHAFRYSGIAGAGGSMVDLGTLGGISSQAFDINNAGFIVGIAERSPGAGGGSWPALWRPGNTTIDLDAWLDATNPTLGALWTLDGASDINNSGLITGTGTYNDGPGGLSDGQRPFILDVSGLVPEPSGVALLGLILTSLLGRRRTRGTISNHLPT